MRVGHRRPAASTGASTAGTEPVVGASAAAGASLRPDAVVSYGVGTRHQPTRARAAQTWRALIEEDADLVSTNYVLVETFALSQQRLGMDALRALDRPLDGQLPAEHADGAHMYLVTPERVRLGRKILGPDKQLRVCVLSCLCAIGVFLIGLGGSPTDEVTSLAATDVPSHAPRSEAHDVEGVASFRRARMKRENSPKPQARSSTTASSGTNCWKKPSHSTRQTSCLARRSSSLKRTS